MSSSHHYFSPTKNQEISRSSGRANRRCTSLAQDSIELSPGCERPYKRDIEGGVLQPRSRARGELRLQFLVLRCQAGDERAFGDLLDWFAERTLTYLEGLVDREDAEDLNQEVWLSVFRGIRTLQNARAFRTWLFRTARHHAIDLLRRRKRERRLLELAAVEAKVTEESNGNGDLLLEPEMLDAALSQLSPAHREVMLLRFRDELSYAEIAMVVGCPIGTVRTRLHHAKRRLYQLLR